MKENHMTSILTTNTNTTGEAGNTINPRVKFQSKKASALGPFFRKNIAHLVYGGS